MITVAEIAEQLNALAPSLAPDLLPNGHQAGNKWMASGIADTGKSASLFVRLSGGRVGHWIDLGNAAKGEEKGDMLDLLRLKRGLDAAGAIAEAKRILGIVDRWTPGARPPSAEDQAMRVAEARSRAQAREDADAAERAVRIKRARGLYFSAIPIAGTPAERYLWERGLACEAIDGPALEWPGSLRFHAEVWHHVERLKCPALVAAIYNAAGEQIGVQRIYLGRDHDRKWTKLMTPNPKMVLGSMWGGFVPIHKGWSGKSMSQMPDGEAVYVTEGIEDALALRMLRPSARIVAAISLLNIGGIILPEMAKKLVIVADRDVSEQAQDQLERAIAAQQARGLDVALVMPPETVKDLNEWLLAWRQDKENRHGEPS